MPTQRIAGCAAAVGTFARSNSLIHRRAEGLLHRIRVSRHTNLLKLVAGDVLAQALSLVLDLRDAALDHVADRDHAAQRTVRSEEHTSELQSLMRISYAVFCLKKTNQQTLTTTTKSPHTKT